MKVLIIDTSHPTIWVAVAEEDQVVAERSWTGDKQLGIKLLQVINELVGDAHPARIAVHRGPGHFMALRSGILTAQLLVQAWGVELVEIEGTAQPELIRQAFSHSPVHHVTPAY